MLINTIPSSTTIILRKYNIKVRFKHELTELNSRSDKTSSKKHHHTTTSVQQGALIATLTQESLEE